jgi:hypothetical protein
VAASQKISNSDGNLPFTLDAGDTFGTSVSSIGDLNQDGVMDIAVGSKNDDDGGTNAGALYILFMTSLGTVSSGQKLPNSFGDLPMTLDTGDLFGASVTPLGDLAGDGTTAIAAGAYADDDGDGDGNARAVYILFLSLLGMVTSRRKISNNARNLPFTLDASDCFGTSLASLGDLNADGVTDLAVSAYDDDDDGGMDTGAVYLLYLTAAGIVSSGVKLSNSYLGTETCPFLSPGTTILESPSLSSPKIKT